MKRLALCLILLGCHAFGAGGPPLTAAELAEKLSFYQSIQTLKVPFTQVKIVRDVGVRLKSEGELSVERPDRIAWKVTKPSPLELLLEGNRISLATGEGKSRKVESWTLGKEIDDRISKGMVGMLAWLKVDVAAIGRTYEIRQLENGEYLCTPREKAAGPFESLTMKIRSGGHLERLVLEEKSGDAIEIDFGKPVAQRKK